MPLVRALGIRLRTFCVRAAKDLRATTTDGTDSPRWFEGTSHAERPSRRFWFTMKSNVVLAERSIRMAVGTLLLASPLLELSTYPLNLLGLVLIATAAVGYCPLYGLLSLVAPKRSPELKVARRA
jgi:hypothetical protein